MRLATAPSRHGDGHTNDPPTEPGGIAMNGFNGRCPFSTPHAHRTDEMHACARARKSLPMMAHAETTRTHDALRLFIFGILTLQLKPLCGYLVGPSRY